MIKIKVNHAKTYLPHNMAKGTFEQRLQKARLMNLKFYDELQDSFRNDVIAPVTFTKILRKNSHKNLSIDIAPSFTEKSSNLLHKINSAGVNNGYLMQIPLTSYKERIHKNNASIFLKETQNFFNEIFNPKVFKRILSVFNKLPKDKNIIDFYKENLTEKQKLTQEALDEFLTDISPKTQINTLQFLRYKLLLEQNTAKAQFQIDKRIEKHNNFEYVRTKNFYSLDKYHYDEKLEIITDKLKNLIKSERILNKNN